VATKAPAALLFAVALILATACGSSDVKADKFADALADKTKLSETEAKCVTDKVFADFDQSTINKLYTANDVSDIGKADAGKFEDIVKDCAKG
jgi:hypothetical protein